MKAKNHLFSYFSVSLFILLLLLGGGLIAYFLLDFNRRSVYYMRFKNYQKAQELLLQALSRNAFSYMHRMNLGLNYFLQKEYEHSIKEYQTSVQMVAKGLQTKNNSQQNKSQKKNNRPGLAKKKPQLLVTADMSEAMHKALFAGYFNSAVTATFKGEIDRALAFYQQALVYHPHSKEVKTNIELLTQKSSSQSKKSDKDKSQKEQNKKGGNKSAMGDGQKQNPQKGEQNLSDDLKNRENWGSGQVEAVLKSIQEQEKRIKQKRDKARRQAPTRTDSGKDW